MLRFTIFILITLSACSKADKKNNDVDMRSYRLGVIGAFSEVIDIGIKKMAFSSTMTPEEMDAIIEEAENVAKRNNTKIYREKDFLVTELFPASVTEGKEILIIYQGNTLNEYMDVKALKKSFIDEKTYNEKNRELVARKIAELLSYPEARILKLLNKENVEIN
jgi:hypothetical protein